MQNGRCFVPMKRLVWQMCMEKRFDFSMSNTKTHPSVHVRNFLRVLSGDLFSTHKSKQVCRICCTRTRAIESQINRTLEPFDVPISAQKLLNTLHQVKWRCVIWPTSH